MTRRRALLLLLGLATAGAVGFVAVTTLVPDPGGSAAVAAETSSLEELDRVEGQRIGRARAAGSDDIAFRVNGHPVTTADVLETRAWVTANMTGMRRMVDSAIPDDDDRWLTPEPDGERPDVPESFVRGIKPLLIVMDKRGPDVAVFGSLISQYASLSAAIEAGYGLTDEEVAAEVAAVRSLFDQTQQPDVPQDERDHRFEAYLAEVGEDTYWDEILPPKIRREQSVSNWLAAATSGFQDRREQAWIVTRLQQDALTDAKVETTEHFELPVTLEHAIAYLEAYWQAWAGQTP